MKVQGKLRVVSNEQGRVIHSGWLVKSRRGEEASFRVATRATTESKDGMVVIEWPSGLATEYYARVWGLTVTDMTDAQEEKLRDLCERYGVEYDPEHYRLYPSNASMMAGWVEGWIGGQPGTIYVGVDRDGSSHS